MDVWIKQAFRLLDTNGDQVLDKNELPNGGRLDGSVAKEGVRTRRRKDGVVSENELGNHLQRLVHASDVYQACRKKGPEPAIVKQVSVAQAHVAAVQAAEKQVRRARLEYDLAVVQNIRFGAPTLGRTVCAI